MMILNCLRKKVRLAFGRKVFEVYREDFLFLFFLGGNYFVLENFQPLQVSMFLAYVLVRQYCLRFSFILRFIHFLMHSCACSNLLTILKTCFQVMIISFLFFSL